MVSVYITDNDIQFVEGNASQKRIKIDKYGSVNLAPGIVANGVVMQPAMFEVALRTLKSDYKIYSKVDVLLDSQSVRNKLVKVPFLSEKKLGNIIKMEMLEYTDQSISYVYDYAVVQSRLEGEEQGSIICTAVELDKLRVIEAVFESAGFKINSIDIDQSALIAYTKNSGVYSDMTFIVGVMDEGYFKTSLFVNGKYIYSNVYKLENRNSLGLIADLTRIFSSLIQFNKSQKNDRDVTDIFICGLTEHERSFCSNITNSVGINTALMPSDSRISVQGGHLFDINNYLYAVGNLYRKQVQ